MADYPPYVNGYGGIPKLFAKIKEAAVPPKFTQDFLSEILELKSSSYRAMIPLMKKLGFVDPTNVPTQAYRDYRDERGGEVMAERLRETYKPLFNANEYAWRLDRKELQAKLKSVLGAAEDDANVAAVAATFQELAALAKWDNAAPRARNMPGPADPPGPGGNSPSPPKSEFSVQSAKLGLSYTINLNLPATTEIEVFNAIFKSLREHLLRDV